MGMRFMQRKTPTKASQDETNQNTQSPAAATPQHSYSTNDNELVVLSSARMLEIK
jgi:hypothetical protein